MDLVSHHGKQPLLDDFCWMTFKRRRDKRAELCKALPKMSRRMNVEEHKQLKLVENTNFLSIAWFPPKKTIMTYYTNILLD